MISSKISAAQVVLLGDNDYDQAHVVTQITKVGSVPVTCVQLDRKQANQLCKKLGSDLEPKN